MSQRKICWYEHYVIIDRVRYPYHYARSIYVPIYDQISEDGLYYILDIDSDHLRTIYEIHPDDSDFIFIPILDVTTIGAKPWIRERT